MKKTLQNKSKIKHDKNETIYIKEYGKFKNYQQRENHAANNASDNGRCWWIHQFILANKYRSAK